MADMFVREGVLIVPMVVAPSTCLLQHGVVFVGGYTNTFERCYVQPFCVSVAG